MTTSSADRNETRAKTTVAEQDIQPLGLVSLLFAATFTIMVGCAIAPTLPEIALQLGLGHHAGWLVTLPALGVVLSGPVIGWLLNGRMTLRAMMASGLFVYGLLGIGGVAVAHRPALLFADRLLLGAPTAAMMASGGALISHFYRGPARLRVISWQGMSVEGGGIVFLAAGGVLGTAGWQYPFVLYVLAWLCLPLFLFSVPHLSRKADADEEQSRSRGRRPIGLVLLVAGLSMTLFFVTVLSLPQVLLEKFHYGPRESGFMLSYISLVTVVCVAYLPRLVKSNRARHLLGMALLLFSVAHLLLAKGSNLAALLIGATLMGAAFALSIPLTTYLISEMSAAERRGRNLAIHSSFVFLGQCFASCVMAVAVEGQRAMLWAAILAAVAGGLVWTRETILKVTAAEIISW